MLIRRREHAPRLALAALAISLLAAATASGQMPLACGQSVNGNITASGQTDFYAFGITGGEAVTIRLRYTSGTFGPLLELYSPTGTRLSSTTGGQIDIVLTSAGLYTLSVRDSAGTRPGTYTLVWQRLNNPCNTTPLGCGQPIATSIGAAGEFDFFTLSGSAGDTITLRQRYTSGTFGPLMEIYSPAGTRLSATTGGQLDLTLTATGVYVVMISDTAGTRTGTYTLGWQRLNNPCNTSALTCGQQISSSIGAPGEIDYFTLSGTVGDAITLRQRYTSGTFGPLMEIYSPTGTRLNATTGGQLDLTLAATGVYIVVMSDVAGTRMGTYTLGWQRLNNPCDAQRLVCGQQITSSIGAAGEIDYFTLAADTGDAITTRTTRTTGLFGPFLELYSSAGRQLGATTGGQIDATLTTAGIYTLVVSDSAGTRTGDYTLLWQKLNRPCVAPTFSISPAALSFSSPSGLSPPTQELQLRSTFLGVPWQATARTTSGGNWLSVSPAADLMPATVTVAVNSASLSAGTYQGTVDISAPAAIPSQASASVTLTVTAGRPASLSVQPAEVNFQAGANAAPAPLSLRIENTGGGTLSWTAQARAVSGNWLSISSSAGTAPSDVQVTANPAGLSPGTYSGVITVRSATTNQTVSVPASLLVAASGGGLLLSQSALVFRAVQGGGSEPPQTFGVLNTGVGALDWTAQSTAPWLRVAPASGRSDTVAAQVPLVTVSVDPAGLAAGFYVGLIRVASPAANNSPQVVRVELQVLPSGTRLGAVVRPTGLIFVSAAVGTDPPSQELTVATPETAPVDFISQPIGGAWVGRTPDSGTASRTAPGRISVRATVGSLASGVNRAGLTVMTLNDGELYPVNLLFFVLPPGSLAPASFSRGAPRAAACTPAALFMQFTSVFSHFNASVGWPTPLVLNLRDDCGNPVVGGSVVLSFSSGDTALALADIGNGQYAGTWRPNGASAQVVVTARGLWRGLQGLAISSAQVGANPNTQAAILSQGGVVLGAGFERGPLAPGSIISLFGSNLTRQAVTASSLPLPTNLGGVRVLIGGREAPLFYVGPGQVNAQVPFETEVDRQLQVFMESGGVPTAPEPLQTAQNRPGIFVLGGAFGNQGAVLIANTANLAMPVTANVPSQPARPGDSVSIYCTGLGATDPAVASGQPGPLTQLVSVRNPVSVTIGGLEARVSFAGLAPGFVGVYQVNAAVPAGISGNAVPLVLTQGSFQSNTATIAVQ